MENKINKIYKQIVMGEQINSLPSTVLLKLWQEEGMARRWQEQCFKWGF